VELIQTRGKWRDSRRRLNAMRLIGADFPLTEITLYAVTIVV